MIEQSWLMKKTKPVEIMVTREQITSYVRAIQEKNPMYYDLKAAKQMGYVDIPLPITMPIIFWQYIDVPWLKHIPVLIHSRQQFCYERPLVANIVFQCHIQLTNLQQRRHMQISEHTLTIEHQGTLYGTAISTLLIMEDRHDKTLNP